MKLFIDDDMKSFSHQNLLSLRLLKYYLVILNNLNNYNSSYLQKEENMSFTSD